ncbi:unnamed protein product [Rotaria sordida]|uniref:MD-2-related lipid-recognition domain-containing protein n=1 Tax=Rotaria sordida TaxID=392033 RepID=A0A818KAY9_9BILA|nr:unnamed protein product [Rotaria sordida]CAF1050862.1 unnamed protein product [Rotaria sordida]CAF1074215.1 unnamed protein product [Rotaria sordida]CAF1182068.1 unnamed protein product [Rotaria sordida]CAF1349075.1 unnamed protein product [Rotaria sordida]
MIFNNHLFLIYIFLFFISLYNANTLTFTISSDFDLSWDNCGPSEDPVQLKSLDISPDPIRVPGNITITGSVDVTSQIPTDVHAVVFMQRKVGPFFVKVPCVDNFGSCNYDNVCELWAKFCSKMHLSQYGLPCECPIPADTYSVSNANIFVNKNLPSELLGEYRTTVDIGSNENHIACINIDLTIKK